MALDKAIQTNKEHRKLFYGAKAVDRSCRNHGSCLVCQRNRLYKNKKREQSMLDKLREIQYNKEKERRKKNEVYGSIF